MIVTYKYYNSRKQRLAISAKQKDQFIEVTIIKCSRKDVFSKKKARKALEDLDLGLEATIDGQIVHPEVLLIDYTTNWKNDLFLFLNSQYYKIRYARTFHLILYSSDLKKPLLDYENK